MNEPIPEDLKAAYSHHQKQVQINCLECVHPTILTALIERIGHVEHERSQLRATRLEDGLTIANQRILLDKYDAHNTELMNREGELNSQVVRLIADKQDLIEETAKLKARTLSCVFCGEPMESVEALKSHSADCPKHPAVIENEKLKAQVVRIIARE